MLHQFKLSLLLTNIISRDNKGESMDQTAIFVEIDEQMQNLRKILLQHAREQDLSDEVFLVELHQLTHRILTLKRMIRNGSNRADEVYKNYLEYVPLAN